VLDQAVTTNIIPLLPFLDPGYEINGSGLI